MIHFYFPAKLVEPTGDEIVDADQVDFLGRMPQSELELLAEGDFLAIEVGSVGDEEVRLAQLQSLHPAQSLATVRGLVPSGRGPWHLRSWSLEVAAGRQARDQYPYDKLICRTELENNVLTKGSVELLRSRGVCV